MADSENGGSGGSRRDLLEAAARTMAGTAADERARVETEALPGTLSTVRPAAQASVTVALHVNGVERRIAIDPRTTLLDAVRDHLELVGTKKGCDMGACGACTVHVDGRRVLSCLTLAASAEGKEVTTIEGLARNGQFHPVQAAFLEHDGFQCGYCTPGQIMSAVALIKEGHAGSAEAIREFMSGNICRCGAYPNIVAAIKAAGGRV